MQFVKNTHLCVFYYFIINIEWKVILKQHNELFKAYYIAHVKCNDIIA
jgi:hypothetical protein